MREHNGVVLTTHLLDDRLVVSDIGSGHIFTAKEKHKVDGSRKSRTKWGGV